VRILVVDDNQLNREVLQRQLEREGYQVVTAAEGLGALALIDSQSFDLLLLDIMMPGLTGIELLKIVRAAHPAHELPVIMATARDTSEDRVEALSLGANDYFTKPIDFPELLARVRVHLEAKGALQNERRGAAVPRSREREPG
jgi:DNA-binding response OmpR family regulator